EAPVTCRGSLLSRYRSHQKLSSLRIRVSTYRLASALRGHNSPTKPCRLGTCWPPFARSSAWFLLTRCCITLGQLFLRIVDCRTTGYSHCVSHERPVRRK